MRQDLTVADRALLDSGEYDLHWQTEVANGDGTMVDLSGRLHHVQSLRLPDPNQPIGTMSLALHRELDRTANASLSPFVEGSTLNRLDDGTTFSSLLELGRPVVQRVALTARGGARPASGYYEVFRGRIGRTDWPKYDNGDAVIFCRDQSGELQKVKSEDAYVYTAGTSIEDAIQQTLDNHGYGSILLYTPTATGKVLAVDHAPGVQKTLWQQVWSFAQSIGWVVWWRYDATGTARLTLFEPDRTKSVSDFTVAGLRDYPSVGINEDEIGNVGYGIYSDVNGVRQTVGPIADNASIAKYGGFRRPFWVSLPEDSPVRDETSMTALVTDAVSDVADPDVVGELVTPANPFLEPAVDLVTVPADGRITDVDLTLAPFSVTVSHSARKDHESRIPVRGRPSVGYRTWTDDSKRVVANDDPQSLLLQNFRARDSADGLSEVITWSNGAKLEEVWYATQTFTTPVSSDAWDTVAAAVVPMSPVLSESLTVTKPTETDGTGRVTLVQVEGRYEDPATGELVVGQVRRREIGARTHIEAIDPDTGAIASAAISARKQFAATMPVFLPVATVGDIPVDNSTADYVLVLADGTMRQWDGSAWVAYTDTPTVAMFPALTAAIVKAFHISVASLSEISDGLGIIVSGVLQNAAATAAIRLDAADTLPATATTYLDLPATGTDPVLAHPGFSLNADGTITWPDDVQPPRLESASAIGTWDSVNSETDYSVSWDANGKVNDSDHRIEIQYYQQGALVDAQDDILPSATQPHTHSVSGAGVASGNTVSVIVNLYEATGSAVLDSKATREVLQTT